jgi:translation initiation factor 2 subunit 2
MKTYEKMLEEARDKLPKDIVSDVRLEIPKPQATISGNQTFIVNFIEITNVIKRDPKHLSKFLFRELATPGHLDGSRLILQGKIYGSLIEKKIEAYLKEYVYCNECGKPDTHLIKQDRIYFLKCDACGARYPVKTFK